MSSEFVHLHLHSDYSLLDGMGKIKDYVGLAKSYGMDAIALTDHGVMYGAVEMYQTARKAGVKPIIGCEMYVAPRSMRDKAGRADSDSAHLLVLARDFRGYQNLMKLVSMAHLEGYYYKPRIDHELLAQHSEGLVITSSCIGGEVPQLLLAGRDDEARERADLYRSIVGRDNYFIEIQDHPFQEQQDANKKLVELARAMGIPLVATCDTHYPRREDAAIQDVLLCVQTGKLLSDVNRMRMATPTNYLRPPDEMAQAFAETPDALSNTLRIAEMCDLEIPMGQWILPRYDVPENHTAATYLRELCEEGLPRRYSEITPEIRERLEYELDIIDVKGYSTYMLIVQDFVNWAREQEIAVTSRGSAAGSLVSYLVNITSADPIEYKLPFERFLTIHRPSPPDIDMDFEDSRREEVIQYVTRKYGEDRVAQIITFGSMEARAAVRDVGRVLGISYSDCDAVAKMIQPASSLAESLASSSAMRDLRDRNEDIRKLLETASRLEGVVRHASTHAAGVIITRDPIVNYAPVQRDASGTKPLVQYDMRVTEDIGLLKMDFLGLANLSVLGRAVKAVKQSADVDVDLDAIPLDDARTYELLSSGETTGVFQLESAGMRRYVKELRPTDIRDVAAMIALYRPGPMDFIPNYIRRKHGEEPVEFLVPQLEPILKDSYGVLVYQDDILMLSIQIAGYTWEEADKLRKAVGKKIKAELDAQREKFIAGCQSHGGISKGKAEELWEWLLPFARYGFGKCVSGSTDVWTADGARMQISQAYALGVKEIMAMWPDGELGPHRINHIACTGKKEVVLVRTQSGRTITLTPEHRLLTTEGYMRVQDMAAGRTELITAPQQPSNNHWAARPNNQEVRRTQASALASEGQSWESVLPQPTRELAAQMHGRRPADAAGDYDAGQGYNRSSVASNGMSCASLPERNMCEWLTSQGVQFEMHKSVGNGRICDFYFGGIYWEMDRLDRSPEYFAHKYGDLPYVVVTPEDFRFVVEKNMATAHAVNGDLVTSIEPQCSDVTYDVEMSPDGPLNYVANGVVSHNSHAAAYALIAYQTAYLKANYPSEYMGAFLTVATGVSEKIAAGIAECKRMGIEVLPPNVNSSDEVFSLERGETSPDRPSPIRFGLGAIKNVGGGPIRAIVAARKEQPEGRFTGLEHLCQEVDGRLVNRRVLESMAKAGAFDEFGTRAQMLAVLDDAMSIGRRAQQASDAGQMSLFGGGAAAEQTAALPRAVLPSVADTPKDEKLAWEKELLGIYITEHPLTAALATAADESFSLLSDLSREAVGRQVKVVGMLTGTRVLTTRKKQSMLVAKLEDLTGSLDFVAFPEAYERHQELLVDDAILHVTGKLDERNESLQLICDDVRVYTSAGEEEALDEDSSAEAYQQQAPQQEHVHPRSYELRIVLPVTADADEDVERMRAVEKVLRSYPGRDEVTLQLKVGGRAIVIKPQTLEVSISSALESDLERALDGRTWRVIERAPSDGEHRVA